jgi:anti-anti-sigma regulatory factor
MATITIRPSSIPFFRFFQTGARAYSTEAAVVVEAKDIPAVLAITRTDLPDGATTVIRLAGDLGPRTYLQPVAVAQAAYAAGRTQLVVDLDQVERITLSGFFALHAMACVFEGQPVPDAEGGIAALRNAIEACDGRPAAKLRIVNVTPRVAKTLAGSAGPMRLPVAKDVAAACAEMAG